MAEPKDKNTVEWRDHYLRHHGVDTMSLGIAIKNNPGLIEILKKYLEDLEGGKN